LTTKKSLHIIFNTVILLSEVP